MSLLSLLDSFKKNQFAVSDSILNLHQTESLLKRAQALKAKGQFAPAHVGAKQIKVLNPQIRSDEICWIKNEPPAELAPVNQLLSHLADEFKRCYLPVKRVESHFAHYSSGGHYQRHSDQHKGAPHRLVSSVLYLAPWSPGCGGELIIYVDGNEFKIEPQQGRFIIFESRLEHEVLESHYDRWSLTSWFRSDLDFFL